MRLNVTNTYQHDDRTAQIISWGHWFTFFNIIITIILGSRYILISDWPASFLGRFYALISTLGQFSFLGLTGYIILLFPLSFILHSTRWYRIIAVVVATIGITLLLVDIEVYRYFRMHLNLTIWEILTSSSDNLLSRQWQKLFIFVPLIFIIEMMIAAWIWKKLRSLRKRRRYVFPVVQLFFACFVLSHLIHIWADANFYRPITMQRASLPLSYPMTARHLLKQLGFIDSTQTVPDAGSPFAAAIEYPLSQINYRQNPTPYNILMVVVDGLYAKTITEDMPQLSQFAAHNLNFSQHYSGGNRDYLGEFTLFYGLDANYYNSILATHKSSVLLDTLSQQHYNLGLFASDGFASALYRYALLSNFSLLQPQQQSNAKTINLWQKWLAQRLTSNNSRWFSLLNLRLNPKQTTMSVASYQQQVKLLDQQLSQIISDLQNTKLLDKTIVVITAAQGLKKSAQQLQLVSQRDDFDRQLLRVPLVIHWPGKAAAKIEQLTTHVDVMTTLMQRALAVTTSPSQYSQGQDLFALQPRLWLISGNDTNLVALYQNKTVAIDRTGHYRIYSLDNQLQTNQKLSLAAFLQLVTDNRRFMVTN